MSINEVFVESLEARIRDLNAAASALVDAVEKYTVQVPGEYIHRSELLIKKDNLKKLLNNGR